MVEDYIKLRKGTNVKTAFKKGAGILWDYLLSNSKDLKLEQGITIELSRLW